MHSEGRARLHLGAATDWLPRWLAVIFPISIVSIASSALGQGYLVPPQGFGGSPSTPQMGVPTWTTQQAAQQAGDASATPPPTTSTTTSPTASPTGPTEAGTTAPGTAGQTQMTPAQTPGPVAAAPAESLMQWGVLHLRARASYQFLYDSGLHSQPGDSTETYSQTFTPGVTIMAGPHVTLDYSPSFRFFSQREFHNTIDHFVSLTAGASYGDKWTFGLSQSFSRTDEPLIETSGQTDEEDYSTGLNVSYRFSDRISLSTSAGMGLVVINNKTAPGVGTNSPVSPLTDSRSYNGSEWLNYKFDQKLDGGVGVSLGYSEQSGGFRSLDEEYSGRVNWRPGAKLSISVSGGLEDRQFLNTGAPDILTPIFSAVAGYQLFSQTTISLTASRTVSASLFESQVTESTQFGIGLQQRLLGHLHLNAGFGYATSDYRTTLGPFSVVRSDSGMSYTVGLNLPFLKHGNLATFYSYTQNTSTQKGFGFSSSEAGVSLGWAY